MTIKLVKKWYLNNHYFWEPIDHLDKEDGYYHTVKCVGYHKRNNSRLKIICNACGGITKQHAHDIVRNYQLILRGFNAPKIITEEFLKPVVEQIKKHGVY